MDKEAYLREFNNFRNRYPVSTDSFDFWMPNPRDALTVERRLRPYLAADIRYIGLHLQVDGMRFRGSYIGYRLPNTTRDLDSFISSLAGLLRRSAPPHG